MPDACFYFQVHQPNRLKPYSFFEIGNDPFYEDDALNREILDRVCERCYVPAILMFHNLIDTHGGDFRFALSLSGVFLEQLEHHRPDVLEALVRLHQTGAVELINETYYHSICFDDSGDEFRRQVKKHREIYRRHFNVEPEVFRNTELIYSNAVASEVEKMGYKGILAEGVPHLLGDRTPNASYQAPTVEHLRTLTRNYQLSDDIAFRFADKSWKEYPLTADKFADWIEQSEGDVVNVFIDLETIGEHHEEETGIFEFWEELPRALLEKEIKCLTPIEAISKHPCHGRYDVHEPTSWADQEKDLSAWAGNPMQHEAKKKILAIDRAVKSHNDPSLLHQWSKMQTSDHFYYMSTKGSDDGAVHRYFSPYPSPYEGYIYFMNALSDLQIRVENHKPNDTPAEPLVQTLDELVELSSELDCDRTLQLIETDAPSESTDYDRDNRLPEDIQSRWFNLLQLVPGPAPILTR